jgi:hypothetical protein
VTPNRIVIPRRLFFAIIVTTAMAAQTATQTNNETRPARKNPLAAYAGTWTGSFEGKPWLTVKLTLQADRLFGSIQRPHDLQFNDQGELKSVSDAQSTEVVEDAQVNPDGLLLTVKNADSREVNRFTMRLTSESTAELKMSAMSMPPGMPKVKPWKLTKAGANPPATSPR